MTSNATDVSLAEASPHYSVDLSDDAWHCEQSSSYHAYPIKL